MLTVATYIDRSQGYDVKHEREDKLSARSFRKLKGLSLPSQTGTTSNRCVAYYFKGGVVTVYSGTRYLFCMESHKLLKELLEELQINKEEVVTLPKPE